MPNSEDTQETLMSLRRSLFLLSRLLRVGTELDILTAKEAPPTSKAYLQKLPEKKVTSKGIECCICLKKLSMGRRAKHLPCKHRFHAPCIKTWLEKTNSCPLCRHELPTDDEEYESFRMNKRVRLELESELQRLYQSYPETPSRSSTPPHDSPYTWPQTPNHMPHL